MTDKENFVIQINGSVSVTRSGNNRNEGNFSETKTLSANNIRIEVEEPEGLAKALADIWTGVFSNYLNNRNKA